MPARIALDVKSRTELIERLTVDQQRQLLYLIAPALTGFAFGDI